MTTKMNSEFSDDPNELVSRALSSAYQGRYAEAEQLFQRIVAKLARDLGEEHPDTLTSASNRAAILERLGRYEEAEKVYSRVLEVRHRLLGTEHPDTLATTHELAGLYASKGQFQKAETLYVRVLTAREHQLGKEDPETLTSANDLASLYQRQGRYREAEEIYERVLLSSGRILGPADPDTLTSGTNLAAVYARLGKYSAAENLYRRMISGFECTLGEDHPDTLTAKYNCAELYARQGRYGEAEQSFEQLMAAFERLLGAEHPDTLNAASSLAGVSARLGRYRAAEQLYERVLIGFEQVLGAEHPETLNCINNLALLYTKQGRYVDAETLNTRVLAQREQVLGTEHPDTLISINNLAGVYQLQGRYREAEGLYERGLAAQRRVLGGEHLYTLKMSNNLAGLYVEEGRWLEAEELHNHVVAALDRLLGSEHPDTLNAMNDLAALYARVPKRSEEGRDLYLRVVSARRKVLGSEHPDTLRSINNLALTHLRRKEFVDAELLFRQALPAQERNLGAAHPDTLTSMNNLALLCTLQGRVDESENFYRRALSGSNETLGRDHPRTLTTLNNVASLRAFKGERIEAFGLMKDVQESETRRLSSRLGISSAKQNLLAIQQAEAKLHAFISLVWREFQHSAEHVRLAIDLVLRRKGLGLETAIIQRGELLSGRYPNLESEIRAWVQLRDQVARKSLAIPSDETPEQYRQMLAALEKRLEQMERELARQIPELDLEENLHSVDCHVVALALPEGSSLVEFLRFNVFNFDAIAGKGDRWGSARYVAFVLPAGRPHAVRMVDLGEAEAIDAMIRAFRQSAGGWQAGKQLRSAVLDKVLTPEGAEPIWTAVPRRQRLLLATDGELNLLPFEALPVDGRYLIDHYEISYLGTGRDLLRLQEKADVEPGEAVVAADPAFDLTGTGTAGVGTRGGLSRDLEREGIAFPPLPGTRLEGERIGRRLGVRPRVGEEVLEKWVKSLRSPRVLHIATHGYFLSDQKAVNGDGPEWLGTQDENTFQLLGRTLQNPMLRSGLALAGSQSWLDRKPVPEDVEDGLLTAEDIATMDLRGTEMVVLSACQTALGEARHGEGVFGLRRGFLLAGAKTVVMSLWKVDDLAAVLLMDRFYENLLKPATDAERMSRSEALREAQRYLRKEVTIGQIKAEWLSDEMIARLAQGAAEVRKRLQWWRNQSDDFHPFREPYYWASFILVGQTGPIG
jgi:CHAT domain-containing protein/tetratricopeptide (TPR) repeat protein